MLLKEDLAKDSWGRDAGDILTDLPCDGAWSAPPALSTCLPGAEAWSRPATR